MVENLRHRSPIRNSDHEILEFDYHIKTSTKKPLGKKLAYFKGDYNSMNNELRDVDWGNVFINGNVDDFWSRFADVLSNLSRKYIPESKSIPKDFNTPWMDVNILKSVRRKNTLWKKFKHCKNRQSLDRYIEARN